MRRRRHHGPPARERCRRSPTDLGAPLAAYCDSPGLLTAEHLLRLKLVGGHPRRGSRGSPSVFSCCSASSAAARASNSSAQMRSCSRAGSVRAHNISSCIRRAKRRKNTVSMEFRPPELCPSTSKDLRCAGPGSLNEGCPETSPVFQFCEPFRGCRARPLSIIRIRLRRTRERLG
jgi:hypothetical protein